METLNFYRWTNFLTTLLVFVTVAFNAQKIYIKDSINNEPIKYAKITLDNEIFYSDSLGIFNLNENKPEFFGIEKSGYEKRNIFKSEYSKDVYLSPKLIPIDDVIIPHRQTIIVGKNFKNNNTTFLPKGIGLGTIINNNYNKEGIVKSIEIPIKTKIENTGFLIINFYELQNNLPGNTKINDNPLIIPVSSLLRKNNKIALEEKVSFPKNGFVVEIQIVAKIGEYNPKLSTPQIQFYNSKVKQSTFLRINDNNWQVSDNGAHPINYIFEIDF